MELNPKSFLQHIQSLTCDLKNRKLLLAFSGGPDSVSLLALLWIVRNYLKCNVLAVYLNHNLRDITEDLEVVKYYRKKYQEFSFLVKNLDVKTYAADFNYSIEEAARYLRYQELEQVAKEQNCEWILTAHHKDDFAETVLMHILEGTGIMGLAGIREQNKNLCRPLLPWRKEDLLQFCTHHQLRYSTDQTNFDRRLKRNQIRHSVLPYLREYIAADIDDKLFRLGIIVQEEEKFWKKQMKEFRATRLSFFSVVSLEVLLRYSPTVIKLFVENEIHFLTTQHVSLSFNQFRTILGLLRRKTGKVFLTDSLGLYKTEKKLWLVKKIFWESVSILQEDRLYKCGLSGISCKFVESNIKQFFAWTEKQENMFHILRDTIFVGTDKYQTLQLQPVSETDEFTPLGCTYTVSVRRYLIEKGIAPFLVNQYPVVKSPDGKVIAVPGLLPDENYKVTEKSKIIFKIKFFNLDYFLV